MSWEGPAFQEKQTQTCLPGASCLVKEREAINEDTHKCMAGPPTVKRAIKESAAGRVRVPRTTHGQVPTWSGRCLSPWRTLLPHAQVQTGASRPV